MIFSHSHLSALLHCMALYYLFVNGACMCVFCREYLYIQWSKWTLLHWQKVSDRW